MQQSMIPGDSQEFHQWEIHAHRKMNMRNFLMEMGEVYTIQMNSHTMMMP